MAFALLTKAYLPKAVIPIQGRKGSETETQQKKHESLFPPAWETQPNSSQIMLDHAWADELTRRITVTNMHALWTGGGRWGGGLPDPRIAAEPQGGSKLTVSDVWGGCDLGQGVPRSIDEARAWCTLAAEQGHAQAQAHLGLSWGEDHHDTAKAPKRSSVIPARRVRRLPCNSR